MASHNTPLCLILHIDIAIQLFEYVLMVGYGHLLKQIINERICSCSIFNVHVTLILVPHVIYKYANTTLFEYRIHIKICRLFSFSVLFNSFELFQKSYGQIGGTCIVTDNPVIHFFSVYLSICELLLLSKCSLETGNGHSKLNKSLMKCVVNNFCMQCYVINIFPHKLCVALHLSHVLCAAFEKLNGFEWSIQHHILFEMIY